MYTKKVQINSSYDTTKPTTILLLNFLNGILELSIDTKYKTNENNAFLY